jgi:lipid A ethanolaminephosphotransferase
LLNPLNVINATRTYLKKTGRALPTVMQAIAADVKRGPSWNNLPRKPTLLVIVVGESARASSFGLLSRMSDATAHDTTPELAKLPITLFTQTESCGTNTATSVPCMFSNLGRKNYDETQANSQDNLLDIYQRAGFAVEWIDNNTGSKNVARRMTEIDVAHRTDPDFCVSDGCHDEILLPELDARLKTIQSDTVLVLHMLGSHGPAYFQRYPERFARFTPICKSVELQDCSSEALKNSYDNSILYTDFVLAEVIKRLTATQTAQTVLFFVSDHGESTGERGFFLHGAPYSIAPSEQTRVPMFLWLSPEFAAARGVSGACLDEKRRVPSTHDSMFPMLLRLMDLSTQAYQPALDPFAACYSDLPAP